MADQLISICIPTYNQAQYLPLSIASACQQTYGTVQVWVADDASTDNTPQVMKELCEKYPNLIYHRQPKNLGIAENCSWLLRQPETEYIIRLDSDDLLHPYYIEALLPLMERHPDAGYAHTAVQAIDLEGNPGSALHLARFQEYQDAETALRASVSGYRTVANIVMFRKDVLHKLNFYEGRPTFVEDYDLSVRLADAGYGNIYCDQILASYRTWVDEEQKRTKRKALQLRGFIRVYNESVTPAFQRRGWNNTIVLKEKLALAKRNVTACHSPLYTTLEHQELIDLLFQLGNTPGLRARIFLTRFGFGKIFDIQNSMMLSAKRFVKLVLQQLRRSRSVNTSKCS